MKHATIILTALVPDDVTTEDLEAVAFDAAVQFNEPRNQEGEEADWSPCTAVTTDVILTAVLEPDAKTYAAVVVRDEETGGGEVSPFVTTDSLSPKVAQEAAEAFAKLVDRLGEDAST